MNKLHQVYLSIGSNIDPEVNLVRAVELLSRYGEVKKISRAWESEPVGGEGPNYLNACLLFTSNLTQLEVKEQVIHPIEAQLRRVRSGDKFAPRTIDIDIVLFDENLCNEKFLQLAFVVVPLAEIHPDYQNSLISESIVQTATRLHGEVWMEAHPNVLSQFYESGFDADS